MKKLRALFMAVCISMFAAHSVSPALGDPIPPGGQDRTTQTSTSSPTAPPLTPAQIAAIIATLLAWL